MYGFRFFCDWLIWGNYWTSSSEPTVLDLSSGSPILRDLACNYDLFVNKFWYEFMFSSLFGFILILRFCLVILFWSFDLSICYNFWSLIGTYKFRFKVFVSSFSLIVIASFYWLYLSANGFWMIFGDSDLDSIDFAMMNYYSFGYFNLFSLERCDGLCFSYLLKYFFCYSFYIFRMNFDVAFSDLNWPFCVKTFII